MLLRLDRNIIYWLVLLLVACQETTGDLATAVSPTSLLAIPEAAVAGETAVVTHIVDGDTIDVEINGQSFRVRYIGMDTPERGDLFYNEATEVNRQLVDGQTVTMVKDVSETDRYGRLLRYIYLEDGTFVNAELVRQGYAQVATFPPDVRFQETYLELEREARQAGYGLWGKATVSLPTVPLPKIIEGETAECTCTSNEYNCADFTTHTDAQACYNYCWQQTSRDVHQLDGDNDRLACESLP